MDILVTLCARGGSKGIPGKNIKIINGHPLVYYSLNMANEFREVQTNHVDIVLSTDSLDIKRVVEDLGLHIETDYIRPIDLATDTAGKLAVIKDVKRFMECKHEKKYDYVLDLDITSPLRTLNDLELALGLLEENKPAYNIFSVSEANRNPYFNMVEETKDGFYGLSKKGVFLSRQTAPKVYDMNASFYFYKDTFFNENYETAITDRSLVFEMKHLCFDLDHPIDFLFMEYLLESNQLDFKL
jgi:CMP-N,N'-diacetyllegionaminic acid synthase